MLVAGYGPYEQGYYAVDVTNPDASQLANGSVPNDPPPAGPTLRWQLTKMPGTNAPLFGTQSATPAITTLFVDPGDGNGAREIGVAILPGGANSGPTSTGASGPPCARAPKTTDSAPLVGYTARSAVRCWGGTQTWTDPVIGRSLSIVRLDTGEILRVFMRKSDTTGYPGDTVALAHRIIDTPLDSPMTGTPIIYPSDVGTDTTKVFLGDADGTVWRFDLSNPDPTQWVGELYVDLYNTSVDTNSTAWSEGQPLQVTPTVALDTSGRLVMNIATGTTETYDNTGIEYVYSVTEQVQGTTPKLRANVNWWLGPGTFATGERVSGPMTVFDGTLYFSTYAAAPTNTSQVCSGGAARLWGRDFVTPLDKNDLSQGGIPRMQPPPPNPPLGTPPPFVQPSDYDSTLNGVVIPGVSIKSTPACASLVTSSSDAYVAGGQHQTVGDFSPGSYSVFSPVGAKATGGAGTRTFEMSVPTPVAPTVIDSWAAVLD
jgi:type IV pilus assembly protein PilY1